MRTIRDAAYIALKIRDLRPEMPYLSTMQGGDGKFILRFKTGSIVDVCLPHKVRFTRPGYHTILVCNSVLSNGIGDQLTQYEIPYTLSHGKYSSKIAGDSIDAAADTSELDDFLSEFKVR